MKKIFTLFFMLLMSIQFIGCANQKNSPNRNYRSRGASSDNLGSGSAQDRGWQMLASAPASYINGTEEQLMDFIRISYGGDIGPLVSAVMGTQLHFSGNGSIVASASRLGIVINDQQSAQGLTVPFNAYFGPEVRTHISGRVIGSQVDVTFSDDYGDVSLHGYISGGTFEGEIDYNGSNFLGTFSLPVQGSIY
jgi:hypothetical protein